jgi:hypothetical protein
VEFEEFFALLVARHRIPAESLLNPCRILAKFNRRMIHYTLMGYHITMGYHIKMGCQNFLAEGSSDLMENRRYGDVEKT